MNRFLLTLALLLPTTGFLQAQVKEDTLPVGGVAERSTEGVESFEQYRPVGDFRLWRFFAKQKTFGQLASGIKGTTEIDGDHASIMEHSLRIDYTQIGGDRVAVVRGESYVSDKGKFLGHKLELGDDSTTETFELARNGDELEGFFTRGGAEQAVDVPYPEEEFFWDIQLVDQLEAYLAFQDLEIGTVLDDSIYLPQSMMKAHLRGQAVYFMWQEIYRGKIDSVYIIRLWEPADYQLYFTPDKKLVRVDILNQNIRVYQDLVQQTGEKETVDTPPPVQPRSFSMPALVSKLPHYVAFLLIAAVALAMVNLSGFKYRLSYIYLGGGLLVFLLMPWAVNPLMVKLSEVWLGPALMGGGSLLILGLVPPLILAVIHLALIWGGAHGLNLQFNVRRYRMTSAAAFFAAGFGLAEAAYLSGWRITLLFDWPLAERAAMLALYIMSGALIGRFLAGQGRGPYTLLLIPLLFITVGRFMPLWVPAQVVDVEAMHFILLAWALILTVVTITLLKRPLAQEVDSDKAGESD